MSPAIAFLEGLLRGLYDSTISFTLTFFVNAAALGVGFMAAGKTRECIFGARSEGFPWLLSCAQCIMGSCFVRVMRVAIWVTYVMQLVLSYVFLALWVILMILSGVCSGGASVISSAQNLVQNMQDSDSSSSKELAADFDLDKYCGVASSLGSGGLYLFLGCIITVVSQAGMMSCLASGNALIGVERRAATDNVELTPARQ
eukprot:TRINITY_DN13805_c0_g1_i2.p1 TRINITY_DN13805_c0_g1~~TRINITY_DN13805_c0_g1_i2.p1  ORF type:complete len:201 (-),score=23.15 TRINITY_DN13805_c0_g1_i2:300-902(-)